MSATRRAALLGGLLALGGAVLVSGEKPEAATVPAGRWVVLELFTSQGCSSCPPADAFLREAGRRPGVLALAHHVDYWNHLGWRDPFSSQASTRRQHRYAGWLGSRQVYTPQLVVQGRRDLVGSRRPEAEEAIRSAATVPPQALLELRDMKRAGWTIAGRLEAVPVTAAGPDPAPDRVELVLILRQDGFSVDVPSGENAGRKLDQDHVVRLFLSLGEMDLAGGARSFRFELEVDPSWGPGPCTVAALAQDPDTGRIHGATVHP